MKTFYYLVSIEKRGSKIFFHFSEAPVSQGQFTITTDPAVNLLLSKRNNALHLFVRKK